MRCFAAYVWGLSWWQISILVLLAYCAGVDFGVTRGIEATLKYLKEYR